MVPRSIGYCASRASSTERCVTGPSTCNCTSAPARASARKWPGSTTRIMRAFEPHRKHGGKVFHNGAPAVAGVGGTIYLAAGGAEIDAAFIERVDGHGVAQHVHVTVVLRQT